MSLEKRVDYYIIDDTKFKKIKSIKNGGYGSIYLVEEIGTNNHYAAKQMKVFNSYDDYKYFVREIDIFMQVNNYCVIGFKGFSFRFDNLDIPTIFLELAEQGSIQSKLDEARKKNPDPNWTITKRMISLVGISYGMMQLHEKNLIHRDLKPGNVLLDSNYHPKITDFGLSKFENKNLEQSISCCGTPLYMAPEISMDSNFTNSVDVYAFAIMAYEIITLRPPYALKGNENPFNIMNKVVQGARPVIQEGDMSPLLQDLLERCWSSNPNDRLTFREISTLLLKEEYSLPGIDEEEFCEYIKLLGKDYESSNTSEEASLQIKEANSGDLEQIKNVADNFFEGKEGFPRDEFKALHYYRLYSIGASKQIQKHENQSSYPNSLSPVPVSRQFLSGKPRAKTMCLKGMSGVVPNSKIEFLPLTQRALQLKITNYNIFVYGSKAARNMIIQILSLNQMLSHEEIAHNFQVHRIYSCGVSLVEASDIGLLSEDELCNFIKEKASKSPKEERLRHCFYCLIGDEDSIFTDNDERIIKYMAKYFLVTIIIMKCTNSRIRDQISKHTSNSFFLEDAMSNPKNIKKGPCIVAIPSDDESTIAQKLQNYINLSPNILS